MLFSNIQSIRKIVWLKKKFLLFLQTINRFRRELANLIVQITPWEMRIKRIESKTPNEIVIQCSIEKTSVNWNAKPGLWADSESHRGLRLWLIFNRIDSDMKIGIDWSLSHRRSLWVGRRLVLHIPPMGLLGQSVHQCLHLLLPNGSRGMRFESIANRFVGQNQWRIRLTERVMRFMYSDIKRRSGHHWNEKRSRGSGELS